MLFRVLLATLLLPAAHSQSTPIFDFHSGFWVNLHHFLLEQAMQASAAADSPEWRRALDHYRANLVKKDMLDREMEAINHALSVRESASSLEGSGLKPELIAVLQEAAPEYRKRWWPAHERTDREWIAAVRPLIQKYGAALTGELSAVYGTPWPKDPIRTDVAEYANWAGAYTTLNPTHITISSTAPGYAGQAALEMLFHEASHALVKPVADALFQEVRAQGKFLPRQDAWHGLLFYTTGAIVARHLDGYSTYAIANGLYERGWAGLLPVLQQDWQPYLEGKIDRASALHRLVDHYGTARK